MIFRTITTDGGEPVWFDVDWDHVRSVRNDELAKSDWRAVSDRVLPDAWKEYRQALRDLPQDYESANDAADNFPQRPE
tara:strand:- start:83 stop:316 length:234 start_codon:yes stop_codon:yes gene_type:complete